MSTATPELVDWIRQNALPLKTVGAGTGFEDLYPLQDWIGDARVVGMGEATHGTREFFQIKHRMFEFLVSELGFTLFIIESPFPEALAVNRYVLTGEGDARHSLASMPHLCWDCEEVAALIEWMRQWNTAHERKVFFYGCDIDSSAPAAMFLLEYLKRRDPKAYRRLRNSLLPLATNAHMSDWFVRSEEERAHIRAVLSDVVMILEGRKAGSTQEHYELGIAQLQAAVLLKHEKLMDPSLPWSVGVGIRDCSMAENIVSLLELHGPDSRALVWAHNGHIQLRSAGLFGNAAPPPLGEKLRELLGDKYIAFGFAFASGAFAAVDENLRSRECVVTMVPETLDSALAAAGLPVFAIDLRTVPQAVAEWFAEARPSRSVGGGYWAALEDKLWIRRDIRELFDALLFVRETRASHRRKGDAYLYDCYREYSPAAEGLADLDFSVGIENWRRLAQPTVGAYKIALVPEGGKQSLEISRSESMWPWDICALSQTVSAVPWRGRRITVRCPASIDAAHDGSSAQLALRVLKKRAGAFDVLASDCTRLVWQRAATSASEMRELAITVYIADSADTIDLALLMTGDGRARFGSITVESAK